MGMPEQTSRFGTTVWPVLTGVAGVVLALWLLPGTVSRLGPSTVELSGRIGPGKTILQVTPFGTVAASTHISPLQITAALKQVDLEQLGDKITTESGRLQLRQEIESQIPGLLIRTAVKETLAAAVVAALMAAALFRQRRRASLVAGLSGAVVMAALLAITTQTFDQSRFQNAQFAGSLAKARQLVEILTQHSETFDEARSRYMTAASRVAGLMTLLAKPNLDVGTDTTAILHISDLHANPVGLEIAQELAREFDVAAVIDTGDLASSSLDTGEVSALARPLDQFMIRRIQRFPVPYLFVPGNHDSPQLVRLVAAASNGRVLDQETSVVGGIEVLGWGDPTYTPVPTSESVKAERRLEFTDEVAESVTATEPDVLAVHDAALAAESSGAVPVVVSGHFHRRITNEIDGTSFLAVGSTGSTGLKSLTVEAELLYEAQVLYFAGDELVAVDYLTLKGLGEDFALERNTLSESTEPES